MSSRCWALPALQLLARRASPLPAHPPPTLPSQVPFERRQEEGRLRLLALLQRCMIRGSKAELILGIPPLHYKVSL